MSSAFVKMAAIFITFWIEINFFSNLIDNELYTGTDADFSGNDPIIYREPLQTDQFDTSSLNGKLFYHNNRRHSVIINASGLVIDNNHLIFFSSSSFHSTKLRGIVYIRRFRVFLLARNSCRVHQLWQGMSLNFIVFNNNFLIKKTLNLL